MLYTDLLRALRESEQFPVTVDEVHRLIVKSHSFISRFDVWAINLPEQCHGNCQYMLMDENYAKDEKDYWVEIGMCSTLDNPDMQKTRRLRLVQETMHVFDASHERTGDREMLKRLLTDIEDRPKAEDRSPQYASDESARWKAYAVLVPWEERNRILDESEDTAAAAMEIAKQAFLPVADAKAIANDYYARIYEEMAGGL